MSHTVITTPRLILCHWEEKDYEPYIQLNMDSDVMKFFPSIQTKEETIKQIELIEAHFKEYSYGVYATKRKDNGRFIGFVGFAHPRFESFFTPCVEIAWRLNKMNWGQGFATEAAGACLEYGFSTLGFNEIYSFTSQLNLPSIRVMQKIGMKYEGKFEHPMLEDGHRLKTHVLYKTRKV